MKLIVTIPAYDEEETIGDVIREVPRAIAGLHQVEVLVIDDGSRDATVATAWEAGADYVITNGANRGLAFSFRRALDEALARGAEVIVNTDADNHYDQRRIPDLVAPILQRSADIVVGSRILKSLPMRRANKLGNQVANFIMQRLLRVNAIDVSSGFRAYSREAALRLHVLSRHTYTHETLFNALDSGLRIANMPLEARHVSRPSRLISSLPKHIWRAGQAILQSLLRYRPLQAYGSIGIVLAAIGIVPFARFLYFFLAGEPGQHIQSLILGSVFLFFGAQIFVVGLLASATAWNRQLPEEILYRLKNEAAASASTSKATGHDEANERNVKVRVA